MPKIRSLLSQLRENKYFSTIDLKDGFFNINLKQGQRHKTTFFTGKKLMQFKRMPQGFKNSPAIFQRAMNLILGDFIGNKCVVYIDDVLCFGKNNEEHDENLQEVLKRLNEYGLEINFDKTHIKKKKWNF